jgi:hypothetical protein
LRSMAAFGMGIQPAGKVVYPEPGRNTGLRSCRPIANGANGTAACCAHWVGMSWLSGNAKPETRPNYKLGCEDFWVRSNCEHKAVFLRRSRLRPCHACFVAKPRGLYVLRDYPVIYPNNLFRNHPNVVKHTFLRAAGELPRGTPENRPMRDTAKPANGRRS